MLGDWKTHRQHATTLPERHLLAQPWWQPRFPAAAACCKLRWMKRILRACPQLQKPFPTARDLTEEAAYGLVTAVTVTTPTSKCLLHQPGRVIDAVDTSPRMHAKCNTQQQQDNQTRRPLHHKMLAAQPNCCCHAGLKDERQRVHGWGYNVQNSISLLH